MKNEVCDMCGAEDNLQVHHISYEPVVTQVLCVHCHQKRHPQHGVGKSSNSPMFDRLKETFILLSEGGGKNRSAVANALGISYMTAYLWDKKLKIKRHINVPQNNRKKRCKITITEEQYMWLREQPRTFNLSENVRSLIEGIKNEKGEGII